MKKSVFSFLIGTLMLIATLFSSNVSAQTTLVAPQASVFAKGAAPTQAGAMFSVSGWGNTGNKTLGWDALHTGGGMWINATRPRSTGSVSNLGWAAPKANTLLAAIPATGCAQQRLDVTYSLHGTEPWYGTSTSPTQVAGVQFNVGTFTQFEPWKKEPIAGTVYTKTYTTAQAPGLYYLYISYSMGLSQNNVPGTGIRFMKAQLTCQ